MTGEIFMREASLTGMTGREVSLYLASENAYGMDSLFQQPGKKESDFQFIDAAGKKWKTDAYFNMLGSTLLHNNASNGKAYVFSAELVKSKVMFVDPQTGEFAADKHFSMQKSTLFGIARIDNLKINDYINGVVEVNK